MFYDNCRLETRLSSDVYRLAFYFKGVMMIILRGVHTRGVHTPRFTLLTLAYRQITTRIKINDKRLTVMEYHRIFSRLIKASL